MRSSLDQSPDSVITPLSKANFLLQTLIYNANTSVKQLKRERPIVLIVPSLWTLWLKLTPLSVMHVDLCHMSGLKQVPPSSHLYNQSNSRITPYFLMLVHISCSNTFWQTVNWLTTPKHNINLVKEHNMMTSHVR